MTPTPLSRVRALFEDLVDAPEDERQRRLDAASANDEVLAREVRELLNAHASSEGFLDEPVEGMTLLGQDESIGSWTVVRELGQGGMGKVYLVERSGADFSQTAACKVLPLGNLDAALLERFSLERQSLARLEHPNIARLLDGGATEDGLPYYVMEYVDGPPIDAFCRESELSVNERLGVFLDVCAAVQHAHQNLIVHRDIKPGNVLVARGSDGEPIPKLLDFGIAKVLDESAQSGEATSTRTRWMTPHYASPEQIRGRPVTTVSDVYSLGVLLYRLLTGLLPFDVPTGDVYAYERAVCDDDPVPPLRRLRQATSISPRRSGMPEDLDWILLKALRREPEQRYGSVEQLADDVRRLLSGRPVLAREGTLRYLLGRFVRRNAMLVGAVAATVLVLLLGVAGMLWSSQRTQAQAERVENINRYLLGLFTLPDPDLEGADLTYLDAMERIAERIDEEFASDPSVRASLHSQVGVTFHRLGQSQRAREQLEQALALQRELASDDPLALATTLVRLSEVHTDQAQFEDALRTAREGVALHERIGDVDPLEKARGLGVLAIALLDSGELEQAEKLFVTAVEVYGAAPADTMDAPGHVRAWNNLGLARRILGRTADAEEAYAEAITLAAAQLRPDHPAHALALFNLGSLLLRSSRLERAEELLAECVAIRRRSLGEEHPDLAFALNQLALSQMPQNKLEAADANLAAAWRIVGDADGGDEDSFLTCLQTRDARARLYLRTKNYTKSEEMARTVVAGYRDVVGVDHSWVFLARMGLAKPLFYSGRLDEARAELSEALAGYESQDRGSHPSAAIVRTYLAEVQLEQGEPGLALEGFERALEDLEEKPQSAGGRVPNALLGAWLCRRAIGEESDPCLAWERLSKRLPEGARDPALAPRARILEAACLDARGESDASVQLVAQSADELADLLGPDHPWSIAVEAER